MDLKKRMYDALRSSKPELDVGDGARIGFSLKVEGFTFAFPNGTKAYVTISRSTGHMPTGEFMASPSFAMYSGPIPEIAAAYGVRLADPWAGASARYLVPALYENDAIGYRIGPAREPEESIATMIEDIRERIVPLVRAFAIDHSAAVDFFFDRSYPRLHARTSHVFVVPALIESSGRTDRLDEFERLVEADAERFGGTLGDVPRSLMSLVRAKGPGSGPRP